jgi:hypothetical protein
MLSSHSLCVFAVVAVVTADTALTRGVVATAAAVCRVCPSSFIRCCCCHGVGRGVTPPHMVRQIKLQLQCAHDSVVPIRMLAATWTTHKHSACPAPYLCFGLHDPPQPNVLARYMRVALGKNPLVRAVVASHEAHTANPTSVHGIPVMLWVCRCIKPLFGTHPAASASKMARWPQLQRGKLCGESHHLLLVGLQSHALGTSGYVCCSVLRSNSTCA